MTDPTFKPCERFVGREIVFRRGRIVGDIVPNATGYGGYVTFLDGVSGMPRPKFVATRKEAREMFAIDDRVLAPR